MEPPQPGGLSPPKCFLLFLNPSLIISLIQLPFVGFFAEPGKIYVRGGQAFAAKYSGGNLIATY